MKKKRAKEKPAVRPTVILILVALFFLGMHAMTGKRGLRALVNFRHQHESLKRKNLQLEEENRRLEDEVKALRQDPVAIERLAREQMRMARPGETIYTFPGRRYQSPPPAPKSAPQPEQGGQAAQP